MCLIGDALLCIFRPPHSSTTTNFNASDNNENIGHCGLATISCAKEICQTKLNDIQIHCAVTYGTMSAAVLGGYRNKFSLLVNGSCTEEIGQVLDSARPGEVVISRSVYNLVVDKMNDGGIIKSEKVELNHSHRSVGSDTSSYLESKVSIDGSTTVYKVSAKPSYNPDKAGINHMIISIGKKAVRNHTQPSPEIKQRLEVMECYDIAYPFLTSSLYLTFW